MSDEGPEPRPSFLDRIVDRALGVLGSLGFNAILVAVCAVAFGLFARETVPRRASPTALLHVGTKGTDSA